MNTVIVTAVKGQLARGVAEVIGKISRWTSLVKQAAMPAERSTQDMDDHAATQRNKWTTTK